MGVLEDDKRFRVLSKRQRFAEFVPVSWDCMPARESFEGPNRPWIKWFVLLEADRCFVAVELGPSNDSSKREQIVARLRQIKEEFGIKMKKEVTPVYTRLYSNAFMKWNGDQEQMPIDDAVAKFKQLIDELYTKLERLPAALRPVFDEWERPVPFEARAASSNIDDQRTIAK